MTFDAAPPAAGPTTRSFLLALVTCVAALLSGSPRASAAADPVGVWPLMPRPPVVRGFDPPEDPWGPGHRGVDLLGRLGQPVRSALPGRVSWSGVLAGRGVVVVDHGATRTTYEPLAARVRTGTVVAAGDRIGRLAALGSHCLPRSCLHWGWIAGETYLDPLRLVGAGPVRLLPLWSGQPVSGAASSGSLWGGATPPPPTSRAVTPYAGWRPAVASLPAPLAQARGWAWW